MPGRSNAPSRRHAVQSRQVAEGRGGGLGAGFFFLPSFIIHHCPHFSSGRNSPNKRDHCQTRTRRPDPLIYLLNRRCRKTAV